MPFARTWVFLDALHAQGFVDSEISISCGPTLPGVAGGGVVADGKQVMAICVTITRDSMSWTVPLAPWPLTPADLRQLWDSFSKAVEAGSMQKTDLQAASGPAFDPVWLQEELASHGLLEAKSP